MNKRYFELDSLRGIAAFAVLCSHFILIIPATNIIKMIEYGPLRIFVSGEEAVKLFFILSGLVLSLPFYRNKNVSYLQFLTKRILRIYAPYYVALFLAIFSKSITYNGRIQNLSDWFNQIWSARLNLKLVLEHILLIGNFPNAVIDPVLWSLVHEMRISIIFPLLMYLIIRLNWQKSLVLCLIFSIISWAGYLLFRSSQYGTIYDFSLTISTISMFIIGALLAKNRIQLMGYIRNLTQGKKALFLIIGLCFYLYVKPAMVLKIILGGRDPIIASILNSYCVAIGAAILIILSLSSVKISKFLLLRPIHYLGKISYSLYLYHSIILLTFIHLYYDEYNIWFIWFISLVGSVIISSLSYHFIEVPSINLGRKLFKRKVSRDNGERRIGGKEVV